MNELETATVQGDPRILQIIGRAAFDFVVSRACRGGLTRFLLSLRESSVGGLAKAYLAAVGLTPDDFDRAFAEYLSGAVSVQR